MPSSNISKLPENDPYDVLGVAFGATDSEISKAYKKLALKLHPDKLVNLSPAQAQEAAKRFHNVKEARAFLLEAEHAEDRRRFDTKRESERLRREADAVREKTMSERRKQMRDQLKAKEAAASKQQQTKKTSSNKRKTADDEDNDADLVEQLRREGKRKRTEYAERDAAEQHEKDLHDELKRRQVQKERQSALEQRQIRLKWDRKKLKPSPSEDSLAKLLSDKFGAVEHVELLGKKGNQALVTFANATSCQPCADFYSTSNEMRAKFVGKRREDEEEREEQLEEQDRPAENRRQQQTSSTRSGESLQSRRLRQAEERERLLREMEDEEDTSGNNTKAAEKAVKGKKSSKRMSGRVSKFPLPLPEQKEYQHLSPMEILEKFEEKLLKSLVSADQLLPIQVSEDIKDSL